MSDIVLVVPIQIDVLKIDSKTSAVGRSTRFEQMPYADGAKKVNETVAPLADAIFTRPFEDLVSIEAGYHLHWSLPDALTHGQHAGDDTKFPAVPNRWLVFHRLRDPRASQWTSAPGAPWVVESDYLAAAGEPTNSVIVPAAPRAGRPAPWAWLGRAVSLDRWKEDPKAERLSPLTAMGWGLPTFAAVYPECRGVFGLYTGSTVRPDQWQQFDVIGWYSDSSQDELTRAMTDLMTKRAGKPCDLPALDAMIAERFAWAVQEGVGKQVDARLRTVCFGRVTLQPPFMTSSRGSSGETFGLAIGNSGTEALSAVLASGDQAMEDQLEALHLAARFEHEEIEIGPAFAEARHEKEFTQVAGGSRWTIDVRADPARAGDDGGRVRATIPAAFADRLEELNALERSWDDASMRVDALRRQLYADWCRYVLSTSPRTVPAGRPDAAKVRALVEKGISALQQALAEAGAIAFQTSSDGSTIAVPGNSIVTASATCIAASLSTRVNALAADLAIWNSGVDAKKVGVRLVLRRVPHARYWQPADPAVGLVGMTAQPSFRHGRDGRFRADGRLECWTSSFDFAQAAWSANVDRIQQAFWSAIHERAAESLVPADAALLGALDVQRATTAYPSWESAGSVAFSLINCNPWQPTRLEWEVELLPLAADSGSGAYAADVMSSSFTLDENAVDLRYTSATPKIAAQGPVYCGTTTPSRHAAEQLRARIEAYMTKEVMPTYYAEKKIPEAQQSGSYFASSYSQVLDWWKGKTTSSPLYHRGVSKAYEMLRQDGWACLTATLDGFHDALLTARRAMQLPIADPAGSPEQQDLAKRVSALDDDEHTASPLPDAGFYPIRTGALELRRLRLVDNFGCFRDVDIRSLRSSVKLAFPGDPGAVVELPPRLCQPARLGFTFLRDGTGQSTTPHPAATPIAGWLVVNHLNGSVAFYRKSGQILGEIDARGEWQKPGKAGVGSVEKIPNPRLRAVAQYLKGRSAAAPASAPFMASFIASVSQALDTIDPDGQAQQGAMALLLGRPIAVVRAAISLELRGTPATNQRWDALAADIGRTARDDRGVAGVKLPIRLGEHGQLNDGLVGYWKEDDKGAFQGDVLYMPQTSEEQSDFIKSRAEDPMSLFQTLRAPPQKLTMLVDPRGVIHATSGILPVKSIRIAPQHYVRALEAIEVSFQIAPLLLDPATMAVPLPREPGVEWTWVERGAQGWGEPVVLEGKAAQDASGVSPLELREGWLRLRSTLPSTGD